VGLILTLLNVGFSLGFSIRIPFTNANLTGIGCIGEKNKAVNSIPNYVKDKLGNNQDIINHSMTTTIWKIEGCEMGIIGNQPGSPIIGFHLGIK
jgi:hypothetical protein